MKTIDLSYWKDLDGAIDRLRATHKVPCEMLFRGIANASWLHPLATTLERRTDEVFTVNRYVKKAMLLAHQLEAVTGKTWDLPELDAQGRLPKMDPHAAVIELPARDFLVYLRHYGFSSPLLDWTASPYVAAYFAFEPPPPEDEGRVAIFAYAEMPNGAKSRSPGDTWIQPYGPLMNTHARHFRQKARYTICTSQGTGHDSPTFGNHSEVFRNGWDDQDVLAKITLPWSERGVALAWLQSVCVDHHTLFETEDALVTTLDIQAFDQVDS